LANVVRDAVAPVATVGRISLAESAISVETARVTLGDFNRSTVAGIACREALIEVAIAKHACLATIRCLNSKTRRTIKVSTRIGFSAIVEGISTEAIIC